MQEIRDIGCTFTPCTKWSSETNFVDSYEPEKAEMTELIRVLNGKSSDQKIFFIGNLTLEFTEKLQTIERIIFGNWDKRSEFDDISAMNGCFIGKEESYLIDHNGTYIIMDYTNFLEEPVLDFSIGFRTCSNMRYIMTFQLEDLGVGDYVINAKNITVKYSVISMDTAAVTKLFFFCYRDRHRNTRI